MDGWVHGWMDRRMDKYKYTWGYSGYDFLFA